MRASWIVAGQSSQGRVGRALEPRNDSDVALPLALQMMARRAHSQPHTRDKRRQSPQLWAWSIVSKSIHKSRAQSHRRYFGGAGPRLVPATAPHPPHAAARLALQKSGRKCPRQAWRALPPLSASQRDLTKGLCDEDSHAAEAVLGISQLWSNRKACARCP